MTRVILLAGLALFTASPMAAADPPAKQPPDPPKQIIGLLDPNDFPGLEECVLASNELTILRFNIEGRGEAVQKRFGDATLADRWEWLVAHRAVLEELDSFCLEAAALEAKFRAVYDRTPEQVRLGLKGRAEQFAKFYQMRVGARTSWYYLASWHHWRWERDRADVYHPPINYRLCRAVDRVLGEGRLEYLLAWADVLATDLLPVHMSQWLTVPMAFMSRKRP